MADVITRFKLETTQYDSKLRDAAKELSSFAKDASRAGNEFQKFTRGNVEAARAFGSISTSATNAKDKVRELVGAYNDMARSYNALNAEQQKSDFGKALAESMQTLQKRIREAKQELQQLGNTKMPDVGGGGLFGGGKLDGMLQVFGGNLMTKAAGFAMSAVNEMGQLVKQSIEVAKSAEGIRIAYDRLNKPGLMQQLKDETHGVVSELELMKAAVKFNDFKLPVEQLGTMLAFAQQKAKDTGQSVDYMVDSIVTGLGRKSLMILDNLGISASEVKEKMKETGDMTTAVGAIIREQMAKAGDYVETAADRAAKANADLENAMLRLGDTFRPLSDSASNLWNNIKIGALDLLNNAIRPLIDSLTEAGRLRKELANINTATGGQSMAQQHLAVLGRYSGTREQKQALAEKQIAKYAKAESDAWREAAKYKAAYNREMEKGGNNSAAASSAYNQWQKMEARAKAWQQTQKDYRAGLDAVLNPAQPSAPVVETPKKTGRGGGTPRVTPKVTPVEDVAPEGSMKALQKEMSELRKQQDLATDPASWQEYQRQIDAVTDKISILKGELPKGKEAVFTITAETSDAIDKLKGIEGLKVDGKSFTVTAETSDALQKIQDIVKMTDGIAVSIEVKGIDEELAKLEAPIEVNAEANVDLRTDFEKLQDSIRIKISDHNIEVDQNALATLMQVAMENGIEGLDLDFSSILQQMVEGADIPPSAWESLQEKINDQLKSMGIEPIKLDVETGNIAKTGAQAEKSWHAAAGAINSVGNALQQVEDPAAKIIGIIGQAIANVALGFAQASASPATTGAGIFGWIAAVVGGTATMLSTIAAIKSATAGNYAEGGIVPGTSYSGDNIRAFGLNSGEVILNRAQSDSIADQLTTPALGNLQLSTVIDAEQIRLVLNNRGMRTGRGEYVQSRFR